MPAKGTMINNDPRFLHWHCRRVKPQKGDVPRLMTVCQSQVDLLQGFRDMSEQEQGLLLKAVALIVRERLVTDETVRAMTNAIRESYKKSYRITSANLRKIPQDESINGMNRQFVVRNSVY